MKKLKRLFANKSVIKSLYSKKMFGFAVAGAGFAALSQQALAQAIISDDFVFTGSGSQYGYNLAGNDPGTTPGTSPNGTNLPGGTYLLDSYQNGMAGKFNESPGNFNPANYQGSISPFFAGFQGLGSGINQGNAVAITLGSYDTGTLAITGTLGYGPAYGGTISEPVLANSYVLVGFSQLPSASASNYTLSGPISNVSGGPNFTGLMALGNGSLQDYVNGVANGSAIAFGGTYSAYTGTTLSYDLNTATGAISSVSFGASTAIYNFTTPGTFSSAYTAATEIGGSPGIRNNSYAEISSYSVSSVGAVPEPSTYALLAGGMLALGAYQYRRRQQAGA